MVPELLQYKYTLPSSHFFGLPFGFSLGHLGKQHRQPAMGEPPPSGEHWPASHFEQSLYGLSQNGSGAAAAQVYSSLFTTQDPGPKGSIHKSGRFVLGPPHF